VASARSQARLGYLSGGRKDDNAANTIFVLRDRLGQLGWRPGDTIEIEERWASGDSASLPGGNITGFLQGPHFLWSKRIELLTEVLGRPPRRLAWIGNPRNTGSEANWADARDSAGRVGSEIVRIDLRTARDIERGFETAKGRDAILVQFDFLIAVEKQRIAALAARYRLPAIYENRTQVVAGGLMSYGGDLRENYRQGAGYVHRILSGTRPDDLPVVQPSRFELVVNVKASHALGLTIPATLLARADEVID
jgi:putative ABC transport system substrate-binding protein